MALSKNAIQLLEKRYCVNNEKPHNVFRRVAEALSLGDSKFGKRLEKAMSEGYFLPNSPCLRNAGQKKALLHACFVIPIEDTVDSIFDTLKNSAIIFHYGGGIGINFSPLRPINSPLSTGGTSSGVVSFMHIFDAMTETVKQGGFRRGALIGILNFEHAEIIDFIRSKLGNVLRNFNISVLISDIFMDKVMKGETIDLINPHTKQIENTVNAKDLFDLIAFSAWNTGDPGLLFYDRINKDNPYFPKIKIKAVNPCLTGDTKIETLHGQIPIKDLVDKETLVYSYDGKKINIATMKNIRKTGEKKEVWKITLNNNKKITATPNHLFMTKDGTYKELKNLEIGERLVSFSDHKLLFPPKNYYVTEMVFCGYEDVYDGEVEEYHNFLLEAGIIAHNCAETPLMDYGACCLGSINVSKFVKYNKFNFEEFSKYVELATRTLLNMNAVGWYPFSQITKTMKEFNPIGVGIMGFADALIQMGIFYDSNESLNFIEELSKPYIEITNKIAKDSFYKRIIAPTGSLSILANCSPSCEPIYEREFQRHLLIGTIEEKREIYKSKYCRVAHEISPEWHLKIQAAWQNKVDGGVSKTINLPYNTSVENIKKIYLDAWKMGVKGITVFRDGSKAGVFQKLPKTTTKCSDESCQL